MTQQSKPEPAQAKIKKTRPLSMVWFIPIIALALGAWLVYKNKQDKGPLITISFNSAAGIEAGKTKIKYKDVDLGIVETIDLKKDLSGVIVSARMAKDTESYLNENTKFWVVKPRITFGGVSGLNTLLSGAYIGIVSTEDGKPATSFVGLEQPPPRDEAVGGVHLSLYADNPGSLRAGSPVYFKQFEVGEIDRVQLSEDFSNVEIDAFVKAPYDQLVKRNSNFWNVSGISAQLGANGISIQLQSVESLISGGIAFDSPSIADTEPFDPADKAFRLYPNKQSVGQRTYVDKEFYILNFNQSIRGLSVGAPVDYRGIEIGEVVSISAQYNEQQDRVYIPVLIQIEPGRAGINRTDQATTPQQRMKEFQQLLDSGFRARLQRGNLLTGQLFISVDIFEDAQPAKARLFNGYPEIPTLSTDLGQITQNIGEILEKVNSLELEKVLANIDQAVTDLRQLLGNTDSKLVAVLNSVDRTLTDSRQLMQGLDEDSITRHELNTLFKEIQEAARSVRTLMETIEENPNSVIFGKSSAPDRQ